MNKNQNAGCVFRMLMPVIATGILASSIIGHIRNDRLNQEDYQKTLDKLIRGEGGSAALIHLLQPNTLDAILKDGEINFKWTAKNKEGEIVEIEIKTDSQKKDLIGGITYFNGEQIVNIDLEDEDFTEELGEIFALENFETLTLVDYTVDIRLDKGPNGTLVLGDYEFSQTNCTIEYQIYDQNNYSFDPVVTKGIKQILLTSVDEKGNKFIALESWDNFLNPKSPYHYINIFVPEMKPVTVRVDVISPDAEIRFQYDELEKELTDFCNEQLVD